MTKNLLYVYKIIIPRQLAESAGKDTVLCVEVKAHLGDSFHRSEAAYSKVSEIY